MEASALPRQRGVPLTRSRRMLSMLRDERLVEQLRRGNEAAFEAIFDRHSRAILSFCRHMLGSRDEAEDAVQQTFVSAYNDLVASDRPINLKPWLYTIARNRCLSMLRARREQAAEIPELPTAGLAHAVEQRDDLRELLADLRELPEDQRAALILSELGDLSHQDIGKVLEVEPVKVKSLVFQARSSLIETRNAREIPCEQIREQLATATGGALRRGPLRRHIKTCEGCRAFRDDVRRQRTMMAAILPVVPTVGLKESALAAAGIGGGGAAAASGGAAGAVGSLASGAATSGAGGGVSTLLAGGAAAKIATAVVLAGGAVAGGVAMTNDGGDERSAASDTPAAQGGSTGAGESTGPGGSGAAPAAGGPGEERGRDSGERRGGKGAANGKGNRGARGRGARRGRGKSGGNGRGRGTENRGRGGGGQGRNGQSPGRGGSGGSNGRPQGPPPSRQPSRERPPKPPVRIPPSTPETDSDATDEILPDDADVRGHTPSPPRTDQLVE